MSNQQHVATRIPALPVSFDTALLLGATLAIQRITVRRYEEENDFPVSPDAPYTEVPAFSILFVGGASVRIARDEDQTAFDNTESQLADGYRTILAANSGLSVVK